MELQPGDTATTEVTVVSPETEFLLTALPALTCAPVWSASGQRHASWFKLLTVTTKVILWLCLEMGSALLRLFTTHTEVFLCITSLMREWITLQMGPAPYHTRARGPIGPLALVSLHLAVHAPGGTGLKVFCKYCTSQEGAAITRV